MLFSLSATALSHNWIGLLVTATLSQAMAAIDAGHVVPSWPPQNITIDQQKWLKSHFGFKKKINAFLDEYEKLPLASRAVARKALADQTNLPSILSNQQVCGVIAGLGDLKKAADALFEYAFGQLSCDDAAGSPVRDRHYADIYDQLPERICPFCGLSQLRGKASPRHHLDHWMALSLYPFAGADLRNLCPMCDTCNATFKGDKDILHDANKTRRRSADPYSGPTYQVVLSNSSWAMGTRKLNYVLPKWKVEFVGNPEEQAETWDEVFLIRSRYCNDVLDPEFFPWISYFARWFNGMQFPRSHQGIIQSLQPFIDQVIQQRFAEYSFLKAEVFRFFQKESKSAAHGQDVTGLLLSVADNIA